MLRGPRIRRHVVVLMGYAKVLHPVDGHHYSRELNQHMSDRSAAIYRCLSVSWTLAADFVSEFRLSSQQLWVDLIRNSNCKIKLTGKWAR